MEKKLRVRIILDKNLLGQGYKKQTIFLRPVVGDIPLTKAILWYIPHHALVVKVVSKPAHCIKKL